MILGRESISSTPRLLFAELMWRHTTISAPARTRCQTASLLLPPAACKAKRSLILQVGRLREAKQALSTAILLVPEHAGAYSNLGSTLCVQHCPVPTAPLGLIPSLDTTCKNTLRQWMSLSGCWSFNQII